MALNDDIRNAAAGSERDPGLTRVYGAAPRDEPPAHLDAAILAAAHREVGARPRPLAALRAWRVPLSLAAVVVLSVSLVTLMRQEGGDELYQSTQPGVLRSAPPAAPAPQPSEDAAKAAAKDIPPAGQRAPRADAPASRAPETQDHARLEVLRRSQGMDSSQAPEPAPRLEPKPFQGAPESHTVERPASPSPPMDDAARAPAVIMERSPAPAMAPPPDPPAGTTSEARRQALPQAKPAPPRAMRSERDTSREDAAGSVFGRSGAPAPRAAEAPPAPGELSSAQKRESLPALPPHVAALARELDAQPPEKWLERIQALRREGQATDARELLAEFKRRYPGHPLPPELQ
jgi:hypothetical protein